MVIFTIDLTAGPVLAAIFVLGAVALAAIWLVPRRQARRWARQGIAGTDLAGLETSARGTVVQVLGAGALILTFAATWMQISDTRNATDRTLRLTANQQQSERFTRAVDQLASTRPEIRIGGIYSLEGVAAESSVRRAPLAHILLAYLQQHHRERANRNRLTERFAGEAWPRTCARQNLVGDDDTQAALGVVVGLADVARPRFKLNALDLHAFRASDADFRGADLRDTSLVSADLIGARFDRAVLNFTDFTKACLRRASFDSATGWHVNFYGADLSGADLSRAAFFGPSFRYARLSGADLRGANFGTADLTGADVTATDLTGATMPRASDLADADLSGADLSGTGLRADILERVGARIDSCTRLPGRPVPSTCRRPG